MQHPNARLTPRGRRELVRLVEQGATLREAASGVRGRGLDGVRLDASLAHCGGRRAGVAGMPATTARAGPLASPRRCSPELEERLCAARLETGWGPRLIAGVTGVPHQTVWNVRQAQRLLATTAPPREAANRYEWPCPGDLLHMDTKRYARFAKPGHAVTGDRTSSRAEKRDRSATSTPTRSSTTTRAWPKRAASRRAHEHRRSRLPARARLVRRPRDQARARDDRQRLGLHPARRASKQLLAAEDVTAPHDHTPPTRRRTARSSASTRPWPANGATASHTPQAATAPTPCHTGSTTTTSTGPTAHSATGHPSAAYGTSRGRTASRTRERRATSS